MKASEGGGYITIVDQHNIAGTGRDRPLCVYVNEHEGILILCSEPALNKDNEWDGIELKPLGDQQSKAVLKALKKVINHLQQEK